MGELVFTPILAHPERYLYMADSLEDFDRLHENGCRFQLERILTGDISLLLRNPSPTFSIPSNDLPQYDSFW